MSGSDRKLSVGGWRVVLLLAGLCALPPRGLTARAAPMKPRIAADAAAIERHFANKGFQGCFLLGDTRREAPLVTYGGARCGRAQPPCSTFKLPHAMFGLDAGVLKRGLDTPFKWDGRRQHFRAWERDHTLRTAFRDSVLWYFQRVARGVGRARMQRFLDATGYGNRAISRSLTRFWIDGALRITPRRQLELLRALYRDRLAVSPAARELGRQLLRQQVGPGGLTFGGKTGTCIGRAGKLTTGWFVGHLGRGGRDYVFVTLIQGRDGAWGKEARAISRAILSELKLL